MDSYTLRSLSLMRWLLAAAIIAGLALSPGLWGISRSYPLSPVLPFLPLTPLAWEMALFPLLFASIFAFALMGRRWIGWMFVGIFVAAVLLDINRLQPWIYQYLLLLLGVLLIPAQAASAWRFVLGCTYLWSGLLKLNPIFLSQVAPWMLQPFIGIPPGSDLAFGIGLAMALLEAAAGIALFFSRSVRVGAYGAIAIHLFILACIGPFGHSWNSVVWPWNVAMIAILMILFIVPSAPVSSLLPVIRRSYGLALVGLVGLLPSLGAFGWWDSYLSFALYSANVDQSVVVIREEDIALLPPDAQGGLGLPLPQGRSIELTPWAMADLNVPPYPEVRAHRFVLQWMCARNIDATLYSRSSWTPLRRAPATSIERCEER